MPDDNRPNNPSDPRILFLRAQHPTDPTKVIQLQIVNTGTILTDGVEEWALASVPGTPGSSAKVRPSEGAATVTTAETAVCLNQFTITAADHTAEEIGIAGDWTEYITAGDNLTVSGSTANDGTYEVDTVSYATGDTTIVFVAGSLTDSNVSGNIVFAELLIQSIAIQGKAANTNYIYAGGKGIAAGLGVAIIANGVYIMEANGYPLDLADIYIDAGTNGEGVTWTRLG